MIRKFVSNALLSVVMDKDARKKLQDMRANKPAGSTLGKEAISEKSAKPRTKPLADTASSEDVIETIAQALAEARAEISGGKRPANSSPAPTPSPRQPAAPQKRTPAATPERERLIQQAMAIHHEKAHVLEDLDPALREKLMVMAMYAMDPSSLPPDVRRKAKADAEAEGLVDDIGTPPGNPGKKPLPGRK